MDKALRVHDTVGEVAQGGAHAAITTAIPDREVVLHVAQAAVQGLAQLVGHAPIVGACVAALSDLIALYKVRMRVWSGDVVFLVVRVALFAAAARVCGSRSQEETLAVFLLFADRPCVHKCSGPKLVFACGCRARCWDTSPFSCPQLVRAHKKAVGIFVERVGALAAMWERLLRVVTASGSPLPERLPSFVALLEDAKAGIQVKVHVNEPPFASQTLCTRNPEGILSAVRAAWSLCGQPLSLTFLFAAVGTLHLLVFDCVEGHVCRPLSPRAVAARSLRRVHPLSLETLS
jgi:hypothetical protein